MRLFRLLLLATAFLTVSPVTARAEGPTWPSDGRLVVDGWHFDSEVTVRTDWFGFEAAQIISAGGEGELVDGSQLRHADAEVRLRARLLGRYLHLELQPYTHIPNGVIMITTVGLEAWLLAPISDRVRVGFYHHSSHNVSDRTFGGGTDMNALVVDGSWLERSFRWQEDQGRYRFRTVAYWFLKGMSSPYYLTEDTRVYRDRIGETKWRLQLLFDASHRFGAGQCGAVLQAEEWAPASLQIQCAIGWRPGEVFLGQLGEHLLIGPFYNYRVNFARIGEFGRDAHLFGLNFTLLFTDDAVVNAKRP